MVPGRQDISVVLDFVQRFLSYLIIHMGAHDRFLQLSRNIGALIGAVLVFLMSITAPQRSTVGR
jgi:hypothetical protein